MMFRVTENAANQVRSAAQQSGAEGMVLRLAARRKPDGSIDYRMGFDEVKDEDIRFTSEGVEIVMAPEDVPLLDQTVMDFVELDQGDRQFVFLNPRDPQYRPAGD
jgi:iron-sulfur cluster assembly protein